MLIFPEIVVYQDISFGGAEWRTNLDYSYVGDFWNDSISSVIVISGTWQFFENADFSGASTIVGPGYYSFVENPAFNMQNDSISSFLVVSWDPQGDNPVFD
jgi:hypothetical protein